MKHKKNIFYFILIITVFLLAFQWMSNLLGSNQTNVSMFKRFLVNLPACIIIAVLDILIIHTIHKKIKFKHNAVRIIINILLTALMAVLFTAGVNLILFGIETYSHNVIETSLPLVLWNSIVILVIEIFLSIQRQIETEKKLVDMEKEKIQYQYEMLKAQINPHFLFNSFNVLSSLAYIDAEKTNLFAKKMSMVYRYLLITNERPTVALQEELNFLESYIFLEQIRFENAMFVEINNNGTNINKQIIPVSLQLLVENALKHNITTTNNPLYIKIEITDEWVIISNNLQLRGSVDKGGVGLKNLQNQYALYDKKIDIEQTEREFIVKIPYI